MLLSHRKWLVAAATAAALSISGLCTQLLAASIGDRSYNLSIAGTTTTVHSLATEITRQTDIAFSYSTSTGNTDISVPAVTLNGASLAEVMTSTFGVAGISWTVRDNLVALQRVPEDEAPASAPQPGSRSCRLSGTVLDTDGLPLAGALVYVKDDTSIATGTSDSGSFSIDVPRGSSVVVSLLGYDDKEVVASSDEDNMRVTLSSNVQALDEIVVVGYGTQKKVNLTGAVSTVSAESLESRPIMNTSSGLGGLVAGMSVRQSSGQPGSDGASILIRGNTTLNSNSPLVLVDGIEWSMDQINTNDIASISVLKDASSTAIYGSRAAAGVILITTKTGVAKGESSKVTYSFTGVFQHPYNRLGWVSDYARHMELINEAADNVGQAHIFSQTSIDTWRAAAASPNALNAYGVPNYMAYPNTDWFNEIFSTGFSQQHNISVVGSSDKVRYTISLAHLDNEGVMNVFNEINSGTKKTDFRVNVEGDINDWLTAGARVFGNRQSYGLANISNAFSYIYQTTPGIWPGEPGKWGRVANGAEESSSVNNIFSQMYGPGGHNRMYRLNATGYVKAKLFKGLSVEGTANYSPTFQDRNTYSRYSATWDYVTNTLYSTSNLSNASNYNNYAMTSRINTEMLLRYNGKFGLHDVGGLAGWSTNHYESRSFNVSKIGAPDWDVTEMSSYTEVNGNPGSSHTEWALTSFFGRLNWAYNDRYLFEANLRVDGSSRFASESRWGWFPSMSAGWRLDQEEFMAGTRDWLSNLKLRASWGMVGNNSASNYAWQTVYNAVNVVTDGANTKGLLQTSLGNSKLKWETTHTTDIGVDFGFLQNRLTGELDAYVKNTSGILFVPSLKETMGDVSNSYANIAKVHGTGVELNIVWKDRVGDVNYSISGNIARNRSKVTKYKGELQKGWVDGTYVNNLADVSQSGFGGQILEGHLLGEHYLYKLYKGSGKGYNGTVLDINAGPKDGMIRSETDMAWVNAMIDAGYTFVGVNRTSRDQLWYGDFIYADLDGDGNYGDTDDRDFNGHTYTPKYNAGLTLSASWKGFDASAVFAGAFGFWLTWTTQYYNTTKVNNGHSISQRIADDHYFYDPDNITDPRNNVSGKFPRLTLNDEFNNSFASDFREYRGDYVKLKNIQVGYTLPERISRHAKVSRLRLFVSGENLFTVTSYPGMDPEAGTTIGYPLMRSYSFGANLTF